MNYLIIIIIIIIITRLKKILMNAKALNILVICLTKIKTKKLIFLRLKKIASKIKIKKNLNEYNGIKDIKYLFNDNIYKGIKDIRHLFNEDYYVEFNKLFDNLVKAHTKDIDIWQIVLITVKILQKYLLL